MPSLVEVLKGSSGMLHGNGVDGTAIDSAEGALGLKFNADYREYLETYGIATVGAIELMGLGSSKRLDVVKNTIAARSKGLGAQYFVIEDECISDMLLVSDTGGAVYRWQQGGDKEPALIARDIASLILK